MPTEVIFGAGTLKQLPKVSLPPKFTAYHGMDAFFYAAGIVESLSSCISHHSTEHALSAQIDL